MKGKKRNEADGAAGAATKAAAPTEVGDAGGADALDIDALKMFRVLIRAAQRHSSWVERQCGVTGAQLWMMQELHEAPGLRVGELAERMAIHQTTASNLLDAIVRKGLADKVRDASDQRIVKVLLSKEGKAVIRRAPKPARGLLPEALLRMQPDDLKALTTGLHALLNAIELPEDSSAGLPLPFMM
ncbi:MarR family winged helix-turn-helix transcriptional regulator [Noviherbaspirillum galbum]|uniref:MarR family transcriptional regulator n=1 Tax=Noviherbaspirillum galbum TaxID=2709383 RepID=A0A6B3SJU8_9BURK|nr:MarR family transcriptional regulator [Noviherbaspirillum galbum]NEX61000.1 MarR family transcriptional regulator [Noviherbaspirillum galbum]